MATTYTENVDWQLDAAELRVLGALMEKEKTTPEYYPMSLNALVNACNQKSNRDPVVNYDEETVETALDGLRAKGLSSRISGGSRVPKHEHRFTERCNLGRREEAVLCVLMLRGPQTVGELRSKLRRKSSKARLRSATSCSSAAILSRSEGPPPDGGASASASSATSTSPASNCAQRCSLYPVWRGSFLTKPISASLCSVLSTLSRSSKL